MKTILLSALIVLMLALPASTFSQSSPLGPLYGNDVQLFNYGGCLDAGSKVCVAGNGWIFVLTRLYIPDANKQYWRVFKSTDNGITFTLLLNREFDNNANEYLVDVDMVVAGDNPSNIRIFIMDGFNSNGYAVMVQTYDIDGVYLNFSGWMNSNNSAVVHSVSIATDYRSPGRGGDPYSLAVAFSACDGEVDILKHAYSLDGNPVMMWSTIIEAPSHSLGKVSISLGGTFSNDWGRYILTFEMNKSGELGDIGVLSNYTDNVGSSWTTPVIVNQTYAGAIGKTRNPSVIMMDNMDVNPSNPNFLPMVIAYEDYSYGYDDVDIMYNSLKDTYVMNSQPTVSDFTVHWIPDAGGFNEKEPNLGFDMTYNNFLLTYTSDNGFILPYLYCGMESLLAGNWAFLPSYRDRNTNFHPWYVRPKLDINLNLAQACFSWTEQDDDLTQKIYFDSQYSTVGLIDQPVASGSSVKMFPNPTTGVFTTETPVNGVISISDLKGRELINQITTVTKTKIDISNLPVGIYLVKFITEQEVYTGKILKN